MRYFLMAFHLKEATLRQGEVVGTSSTKGCSPGDKFPVLSMAKFLKERENIW
jgi:hypothetical protein